MTSLPGPSVAVSSCRTGSGGGSSAVKIILIIVAVLNWLVVPLLFPTNNDWLTIYYTFFKDQVAAKHVTEITSQGSTIQGHFKSAVTDPAQQNAKNPQTYTKFTT